MTIQINGTNGISGVDGSAGTPALQGSDTNTGIAFGSDVIIGSTGGTERFRCDSSGRVLVGTSSSPSAGSGQYSPLVVQGYIGLSTGDGSLSIQRGEGAATITSGEEIGGVYFNDNAGNTFANIKVSADANAGASDFPGRLVLSTTADGSSSPTERMRISQDGTVSIGVPPALSGARFVLYGANTLLGTAEFNTPKGTNNSHIHYGTDGDWYIRPASNSGSVYVKNYVAESDARLKENIADSPYGLECLLSLRPRTFNWVEGDGSEQIGFVAQEVEQSAPSFVSEGQWKSVDYQAITSTLVKALQEAASKIESLETRLAALEVTP